MTNELDTKANANDTDQPIRERIRLVAGILAHGATSSRRELLAAVSIAAAELGRLAGGERR